MNKLNWLSVGIAVLFIGAAALLHGQSASPTVGALSANPAYVVINQPTDVLFTVHIPDASVIPTGVNLLQVDETGKTIRTVGVMRDDGANGDVAAGDKVFSLHVPVNREVVGQEHYRVSAAFKGVLQRVQSPNVTVSHDPFLLPPDPGEAGKQTLAGIDSDADGVRDDIQRRIYLSIPDASQRHAVMSYVTTLQSLVLNSDSPDVVRVLADHRRKAAACWDFLNASDDRVTLQTIEAHVVNTPDRLREYLNADRWLVGQLVTPPQATAATCEP